MSSILPGLSAQRSMAALTWAISSGCWTETIKRSQRELKGLLEDSPSLRQYWDEIFLECYINALATLRENYDYQSFAFPDDCPFPQKIDQILQQTSWRK